jgi:hypothetical protein
MAGRRALGYATCPACEAATAPDGETGTVAGVEHLISCGQA